MKTAKSHHLRNEARVRKVSRTFKAIQSLSQSLFDKDNQSMSARSGFKSAYFAAGSYSVKNEKNGNADTVRKGFYHKLKAGIKNFRGLHAEDIVATADDTGNSGCDPMQIKAISILLEKELTIAERKDLAVQKNEPELEMERLISLRGEIRKANLSGTRYGPITLEELRETAQRVIIGEVEKMKGILAEEQKLYETAIRSIKDGTYKPDVHTKTSTPFEDLKRIMIAMANKGMLKEVANKDAFVCLVKFMHLDQRHTWPHEQIRNLLECFIFSEPAEFVLNSCPDPSTYTVTNVSDENVDKDATKSVGQLLVPYDAGDIERTAKSVRTKRTLVKALEL